LSAEDFNEMSNVIKYFYNTIISEHSLKELSLERKKIFYNLVMKIKNKQKNIDYNSLIYAKSLFNLYDNNNIDKLNVYFNNFLLLLYKDLNVEIKNNKLIYDEKNSDKMEYLLFYLKRYI